VVGEPTQVTPEGYDIYPVSATMDCTGGNCGADYIAGNVVEFFDQDSGPPEEYTTRCAGCKQVKS
ncbi:hypothetical protein KBD81_06300, partial [Candidatus Woesebacteria bacterium]|nr:hypothetical protein [Candidatus Woesebacteria bacterium]